MQTETFRAPYTAYLKPHTFMVNFI